MIRRVNFDNYFLGSKATPANFGGWEAGVYRPHTAAQQRRKTIDVFKRSAPKVSLNPLRAPRVRWNGDDAA